MFGFGRWNALEPASQEIIRILVVDSDLRVGRRLVRLLKPAGDIEVVAIAVDAGAALELAAQLHPAVALVDVGPARVDGIEITRNLCHFTPVTRVVAVSIYATNGSRALAAGACRFLLKDCGRDDFAAAIRLAARGQCQSTGAESPQSRTYE